MGCGTLVSNGDPNCITPFQGGVGNDSRLILLERSAVSAYTMNSVGLITGITLVSGQSGWSFKGYKQTLKPNYKRAAAPGSGKSVYQHKAEYYIYDYSQAQKFNLERKGDGRYIGIFENSSQDANSFELMGKGVGLELLELERSPGDNGGAFKVILQTPENEFEARLPQTLLSTDYAGTLTLVEGSILFLPTITAGGLSIVTAVAATPTSIAITGTNFFGGGSNNAVLKVELVNQATLVTVPFVATPTVTNTLVTVNTPSTVAGTYKVKVTTVKGESNLSLQNLILT